MPALLQPYYFGANQKWDDFILEGKRSNESLARIDDSLSTISKGLQENLQVINDEINWGLNLVFGELTRQTELIDRMLKQIDRIQATLASPLITQAQELFRLGEDRLKKGLLDKALEAYLEAEKKNEVSFPLQLRIGELFYKGVWDGGSLVDFQNAEKHLLLAARYAKAQENEIHAWYWACGRAWLFAGEVAYLKGAYAWRANEGPASQNLLATAIERANHAERVWPECTEVFYLRAKCYALLGSDTEALANLFIAIDRNRSYVLKAGHDNDFESLASHIMVLAAGMKQKPGPVTQCLLDKLNSADRAIDEVKSAKSDVVWPVEYEECVKELAVLRRAMTLNTADIVLLLCLAMDLNKRLFDLTKRGLDKTISELQTAVQGFRNQIVEVERAKKEYEPGGLGCLFSIVGFFSIYLLGKIIATALPKDLADFVFFTFVMGAIAAGLIGMVARKSIGSVFKKSEWDQKQEVANSNAQPLEARVLELQQKKEHIRSMTLAALELPEKVAKSIPREAFSYDS